MTAHMTVQPECVRKPRAVGIGAAYEGGANCASASGLARASVLRTARPLTTSATASSVILPLRVRGMSATAAIARRNVAGRAVLAQRLPDPGSQRVVEPAALGEAHEQHDARVAVPLLPDGDGLEHLGQLLDLAVDLGGADAHARPR